MFQPAALNQLLENDNIEKRAKLKAYFKDSLFVPRFDVSLRYEREIALERLRRVADAGYISVFDFERNPLNVFAGKRRSLQPARFSRGMWSHDGSARGLRHDRRVFFNQNDGAVQPVWRYVFFFP